MSRNRIKRLEIQPTGEGAQSDSDAKHPYTAPARFQRNLEIVRGETPAHSGILLDPESVAKNQKLLAREKLQRQIDASRLSMKQEREALAEMNERSENRLAWRNVQRIETQVKIGWNLVAGGFKIFLGITGLVHFYRMVTAPGPKVFQYEALVAVLIVGAITYLTRKHFEHTHAAISPESRPHPLTDAVYRFFACLLFWVALMSSVPLTPNFAFFFFAGLLSVTTSLILGKLVKMNTGGSE